MSTKKDKRGTTKKDRKYVVIMTKKQIKDVEILNNVEYTILNKSHFFLKTKMDIRKFRLENGKRMNI